MMLLYQIISEKENRLKQILDVLTLYSTVKT